MNTIAIRIAGVAALAGTAVCASTAVALTPADGTFRGQVQQADRLAGPPSVAFTVTRARRVARVATADVSFALRCEDGTSFARTMHLPSAPIRRGAFRIQESNGGGFGAEGQIRLSILFKGRFQTSGLAHGTLRARAVTSDSVVTPSVACKSGLVRWSAVVQP